MFRALLWKEWREQKPQLVAVLLCSILAVGKMIMHSKEVANVFSFCFLVLLWPLSAVLAGSGTVAGERNGNTLSFLFSLPISRVRIWCIKVFMAALSVGMIILATILFDRLFLALVGHGMIGIFLEEFGEGHVRANLLFILACLSVFFSTSILASTVLKQPLHAAGIGLVGGALLSGICYTLISQYYYLDTWFPVDIILLSALLLLTSLFLFCRGEMVRGPGRRTKWILMGLMGLLVAAMIATPLLRFFPPLTMKNARIDGMDLSLDGSKLLFDVATINLRSPQVWLHDRAEGKVVQLTSSGAQSGSFAPDGERIAYLDKHAFSSQVDLRLVHRDGSNDRLLLSDLPGDWGGKDVFVYRPRTSGVDSIKFSPHGKWVALMQDWHLIVAATNDNRFTTLELEDIPEMLGWTADGREILLLSSTVYGANLEAYNVESKTARMVTALDPSAGTPVGWHPMGGIRFLPIVQTENESGDLQLLLVDVINGDTTTISNNIAYTLADFLEERGILAYTTHPSEEDRHLLNIHIHDIKSGEDTILATIDSPPYPDKVCLSPDASRIIVSQGCFDPETCNSKIFDLDGNVRDTFPGLTAVGWSANNEVILADSYYAPSYVGVGDSVSGEVTTIFSR